MQVDGSLSVGIPAAGSGASGSTTTCGCITMRMKPPRPTSISPMPKAVFQHPQRHRRTQRPGVDGENGGSNRYILRPMENGGAYLGTTSMRWNTGFFTNTITQSDLKRTRRTSGDFRGKRVYHGVAAHRLYSERRDGGRVHMGFGAQQVAQAAAEHGMGDLSLYQAVVVEPDGSEHYFREGVPDESLCWGLNYSELIAPPCPDGTGVGNPAFPDGTGRPWAVRPDKRNGGMLMSIMHKVKWGDTLWDLSGSTA